MNTGLGLKIKHIVNLLDKRRYAVFARDGFEYISYSAFCVLKYLREHKMDAVSQKDIENALMANRATVSKMLQQMEKNGCIRRTASRKDRREKNLTLTDAGEELYLHNVTCAVELDTQIAEILDEKDFEDFERIYRKLICGLTDN